MIKRTGRFINASVKGANHTDKGTVCQDAASSAALYHRGNLFYFMAVADGHGGAAYTRSDIGSFLALQAASECVNRFIIYAIDTCEKYPDSWFAMVKEDFSSRLGKILVSNWVRMVEAHAKETGDDADEIVKLYGTTISVALVFNNYLFTGRIGDSSVFTIVDQDRIEEKQIFTPFSRLTQSVAEGKAADDDVIDLFEEIDGEIVSLGLGTASLCSKDAYRKWQTQAFSLDDVKMILLATDGFADSLENPKEVVKEYYRYIVKRGLANFEKIIDEQLKQVTQKGVGDDISLVIFFPD